MTRTNIVLAQNVSLIVTAGSVTLCQGDTGRVSQLNPAGSHCLIALLDGKPEGEVTRWLADCLDEPIDVVAATVRELLDELLDARWIQRVDRQRQATSN